MFLFTQRGKFSLMSTYSRYVDTIPYPSDPASVGTRAYVIDKQMPSRIVTENPIQYIS